MNYQPRRVGQVEQQRIRAVAVRVEEALREAGLPMNENHQGLDYQGGVEIEVDLFDGVSGVYVDWSVSSGWYEEVRPRALLGDAGDPRFRQLNLAESAMRLAIASILEASGLCVESDRDDMRPLALFVSDRNRSEEEGGEEK
ncbi:hypothetical protein [Amycolatopsis sp. NPDC059657]|uniref:hypothetical protein n=1 Tax=Amycolatopsis sp. NPDC059657 TaxID=3346899 RepID=UPI00366CAEA4